MTTDVAVPVLAGGDFELSDALESSGPGRAVPAVGRMGRTWTVPLPLAAWLALALAVVAAPATAARRLAQGLSAEWAQLPSAEALANVAPRQGFDTDLQTYEGALK